ncbi:hypothetical protein AWC13_04775 [Mycobacterium kubicae]|uniref:DUF3515 domain-containing protein n=1 Tax=Mycobacterium kubicae TaxID=120959 RepID=A0AAX1JGD4_9MYCO|nr:DUF3515 domain-containing protein [Mycobacterium kubicae]OBK54752.1 hypothetical protein A5657_12470 [Mycobacterium kubicae]ORW02097.1 hypothetical protein AWC13_04775 [Mycobacterium kubicae]QNI11316.1 DUF3515 domain-containing protein [Mycobacterium kubicae]QPI40625.1 DUF3515 domain-containing protein [Mycobacterium kubicae]
MPSVGDRRWQVPDADGPPRALLIAAVALAVTAIGVVLFIAVSRRPPQQPVTFPPLSAPHANAPACQALMAALPQQLGDYQRAAVTQPAPDGAAAWRTQADSEPVLLRCGLDRPAEFVVGSPIQVVDRVQWFEARKSTWYTVDRPVYVALTLPAGSGPTPIQALSDVIDHTITAVAIDPAPAR